MMHRAGRLGLLAALGMALSACQISLAPDATRAAPLGYERLFSPHPHAYRVSVDGEPVRRGRRSERFELRDGDCGGSDCASPRYRSEVRQEDGYGRIGRDAWYGWSFYNQNIGSLPEEIAIRPVFGQWKMGGTTPAIFRIVQMGEGAGDWERCDPRVCGGDNGRGDVAVQLVDLSTALDWGPAQNQGHVCRLFDMRSSRGSWVDVTVNTNFSDGPDGYLRIWVNGQQVCNYRGQLVATRADGEVSHRRGIFASYTARWDEVQPGAPKPTMIAFYDEFAQGRTQEAVDVRRREMIGRRPKS